METTHRIIGADAESMSRGLTANAKFFPTLAAPTALVDLHWLLAELSRRNRKLGRPIKGGETLLVEDGMRERAEENQPDAARPDGGVALPTAARRASRTSRPLFSNATGQ